MSSDAEYSLGVSFTRMPPGSDWFWQWMHRTLSSHNVLDIVQTPAEPNAALKDNQRLYSAVHWLSVTSIILNMKSANAQLKNLLSFYE